MYDYVDDANFALFAAKAYSNPNCVDVLEFTDDVNRIKYIKRLFNKYLLKGDLKDRLVMNHLIVLYNVFEKEAITQMLVYKLEDYLPALKPFLVLLNFWPDKISGIGPDKKTIFGSDIIMDPFVVDRLRKI
jgi:hypothetical protein